MSHQAAFTGMPLSESEQVSHGGITVREAAACFGLDVCSSRRISGGFSGAAVFRATDVHSRRFAIRLIPLEMSLPEQRLDLLHSMLCCVQQHGQSGIAIPLCPLRDLQRRMEPLRAGRPSSCVLGNFRVHAEPWIDGLPVEGVPTPEQLSHSMTYLSSLHQRLKTAVSVLPENSWFFLRSGISPGLLRRIRMISELLHGGLEALLSNCEMDLDSEFRKLAARTGNIVRIWLPQLKSLTSPIEAKSFLLQPVLRDVWRPHVLFQNNEVSGVIDVMSAASDHPVLDYARLFRSWFGSDWIAIEAAYLELAEHCHLNAAERLLLKSIDACSSILSPITWLNRRIASVRTFPLDEDKRSRMEEVVRIAESFRLVPLT